MAAVAVPMGMMCGCMGCTGCAMVNGMDGGFPGRLGRALSSGRKMGDGTLKIMAILT